MSTPMMAAYLAQAIAQIEASTAVQFLERGEKVFPNFVGNHDAFKAPMKYVREALKKMKKICIWNVSSVPTFVVSSKYYRPNDPECLVVIQVGRAIAVYDEIDDDFLVPIAIRSFGGIITVGDIFGSGEEQRTNFTPVDLLPFVNENPTTDFLTFIAGKPGAYQLFKVKSTVVDYIHVLDVYTRHLVSEAVMNVVTSAGSPVRAVVFSGANDVVVAEVENSNIHVVFSSTTYQKPDAQPYLGCVRHVTAFDDTGEASEEKVQEIARHLHDALQEEVRRLEKIVEDKLEAEEKASKGFFARLINSIFGR